MLFKATTDPAVLTDRIVGSILGVFIGDALGVGVHWQYDLDKLERDRGFVTDYLDPLPGTFHSGTPDSPGGEGTLVAGQLEQQGAIDKLLLESLVEQQGLDQDDFFSRFEEEILLDPTMDGTRQGGKYGWTDKSICELYASRIVEGKPWSECQAPRSDTPDTLVRAALIAALYWQTPKQMSNVVQVHAKAATGDSSVQAHSVAFANMIAAILQGVPVDNNLSSILYTQAGRPLPFSSMNSTKDFDETYGHYTEPDSLLWFGEIAKGVAQFQPEPAHRGVQMYGQFCALFACVPSAYYCAARFPESFEDAILCSVNGGGQNTMRSSLVGAMLGARVGLSGIPQRFIDGLDGHEHILDMAHRIAQRSLERKPTDDDTWHWPMDSQIHSTETIGKKLSITTEF
jgi:ADP-ribosylglycohydrolase